MEDECLAGDLEQLIYLHVKLHEFMLKRLPEPDKSGHETLLKNVIESLNNISKRNELGRAIVRLEALGKIILYYIDDQVRAGTALRCSKSLE